MENGFANRLRRDGSGVRADAADDLAPLADADRLSELGALDGGTLAGRTGADDEEIEPGHGGGILTQTCQYSNDVTPRALLLDMDGVLVFSEEAWFAVYNETLVHFGREPISRTAFDTIYGNGTEADRQTYMPDRTVEEINEAYSGFFERHLDRLRANAEAAPFLAQARARGVKAAVATNTTRPLAGRILALTGLLPLLDDIVAADEAGAGKPDPAVLHLASARLGVALAESLFVGDSRYDAEAAARAPVAFIGYRFGNGDRIASLSELLLRLPGPAAG
jgi:phosphoglycolate phosphatase